MIDNTLIDHLTVLANKEKRIRLYSSRVRIRGSVVRKVLSKKGNITLRIKSNHLLRDVFIATSEEHEYIFTVLKSHKERFALAKKVNECQSASVEGIAQFGILICTRLKVLEKGLFTGKQTTLLGAV